MKQRPRSIERKVAEELSKYFVSIGASEIKRVPILGRTGPDLDVNEVGLIIDVKSRLEIPEKYFCQEIITDGELVGLPLKRITEVENFHPIVAVNKPSKIVRDYLAHMDEWTKVNSSGDISALVLHRPKMPIGQAMLYIHKSNLEVLSCRIRTIKSLSSKPAKTSD